MKTTINLKIESCISIDVESIFNSVGTIVDKQDDDITDKDYLIQTISTIISEAHKNKLVEKFDLFYEQRDYYEQVKHSIAIDIEILNQILKNLKVNAVY